MTQAEAAAVAVMSLLAALLVVTTATCYYVSHVDQRIEALEADVDVLRSRLVLVEAQHTGNSRSLVSLEAWRRARQGGYDTALEVAAP